MTLRPSPRRPRLVIGLVVMLVAAGAIGSALAPVLSVKHPWLLIVLSPDARHVVLAAGSVPPVLLVATAVVRRTLFSLGTFGLGAAYGAAAMHWLEARQPRLSRVIRLLERAFERFGTALLILLPFATLCLVAGATRTRFVSFLPSIVAGHVLWVSSTYFIGAWLSDYVARILAFFSAHLLESTLVCVLLVSLQQVWSRRRRRRPAVHGEPA